MVCSCFGNVLNLTVVPFVLVSWPLLANIQLSKQHTALTCLSPPGQKTASEQGLPKQTGGPVTLAAWHIKWGQTHSPVLQPSIWETDRSCPHSLCHYNLCLCELTQPLVAVLSWVLHFSIALGSETKLGPCSWSSNVLCSSPSLGELGSRHDKQHLLSGFPQGNAIKYLLVRVYVGWLHMYPLLSHSLGKVGKKINK